MRGDSSRTDVPDVETSALVVIELKNIGQMTRDMGWVEQHLCKPGLDVWSAIRS
jgi:hypothetical protein